MQVQKGEKMINIKLLYFCELQNEKKRYIALDGELKIFYLGAHQ